MNAEGAIDARKAFATPWEVCYDVAYPPSSCIVQRASCIVRGKLVLGALCLVLGAGVAGAAVLESAAVRVRKDYPTSHGFMGVRVAFAADIADFIRTVAEREYL